MTRIRTLLVVCAFALPIPAVIAGCGGSSSSNDEDPQEVIDQTFNNDTSVSSGNLTLDLNGSAEGDQGGSFEAKLSGPFQGDESNSNSIPQLDWTGSISGSAAGQSLSADGSLVVTGDNAYVEYGGNTYEVGTRLFSQFQQAVESASKQQSATQGLSFGEAFKQGCEQSIQAQGGDPSACDIDFQSWLTNVSNDGTEDIEGESSIHVSGDLNVDTMLQDLISLGTSLPQAASQTPSDEQIQQISDAISEASFDLYSRESDHVLDGLDFNLAIDPSQIPEASASGLTGINASLSLRLGGINEDQTISAPANAQPITQLLRQFGLSSGLGGLGGLGGSSLPGSGASGQNGSAYLDCVQQASTPQQINQCASQL